MACRPERADKKNRFFWARLVWCRIAGEMGSINFTGTICQLVAVLGLLSQLVPAYAQTPYASRMTLEKLQTRTHQLERELREITGRLETTGFELNQTNQRLEEYKHTLQQYEQILQDMGEAQTSREAALNARLHKLETRLAKNTVASLPVADTGNKTALPLAPGLSPQRSQGSAPLDEASQLLQAGLNYLLNNNYPAAEASMHQFIEKYAGHRKRGQAQYVLGEALLLQEFYTEAARAYIVLLSQYADSPNAPEGLVKLAKVMRMMDDKVQACAILAELPIRYPQSSPLILSIASAERNRSQCT